MHDPTGNEGDTKDIEIHDFEIQGSPITLLDPPDTLTYELRGRDGLSSSGNIGDFFYVDDDPTDEFWRITVPLPMNNQYTNVIIQATKGVGVRTWKVPISIESV